MGCGPSANAGAGGARGNDDIALVESSKEQIAQLNQEITQLQGRLDEARRENEQAKGGLQGDLKAARDESDRLREELKEKTTRLQQLEEQLAALQSELAQCKEKLQAASANPKKKKSTTKKKIDPAEVARIQQELQQANATVDKLKQELSTPSPPPPAAANNNSKGGSKNGSSNNIVLVSNAGAPEPHADLEKIKQELHAERQLSGQLRAELRAKTKEQLAEKSQQAMATKSSSTVVVLGAAEYMKMNELELRSQVELLGQDLERERAARDTLSKENDRLSDQVAELSSKLSGKDKTIGELTVKLHEVMGEASEKSMSGLDSQLAMLDAKHDKLDGDMELMEENLRLQALLNEKEELIAKLQAGK